MDFWKFAQLKLFPMRRGIREKDIERLICDYLTYKGFDVVKIPSSGYFDASKGRFRKHTSPYVRNGIPDLMAIKLGVLKWYEVKAEKGSQSPAQKAFEMLLKKNGQEYYVVRSIEDVENTL